MAEAIEAADGNQDRETRMRFMRIDASTGKLLREFWTVVEPALPGILESFYRHVTSEPRLQTKAHEQRSVPSGNTNPRRLRLRAGSGQFEEPLAINNC
jgi:hypothetical protein